MVLKKGFDGTSHIYDIRAGAPKMDIECKYKYKIGAMN
jgi:hypothetical protein